MALEPDQTTGYVGPPKAADTLGPQYPKWMYHATKAPVLVEDATQEAVLVAGDSGWTPTIQNPTV